MIRIKNNTNKQLSKKCNKVNEWQWRQKDTTISSQLKKYSSANFLYQISYPYPFQIPCNQKKKRKRKEQTNKQKKLLN